MIKHITGLLFLLTIKAANAYLPYPECLEDEKGCDLGADDCEQTKELNKILIINVVVMFGILVHYFIEVRKLREVISLDPVKINDPVEQRAITIDSSKQESIQIEIPVEILESNSEEEWMVNYQSNPNSMWANNHVVHEKEKLELNHIKQVHKFGSYLQTVIHNNPSSGHWKEYENMNMLNKGGFMLIQDWGKYKETIIEIGLDGSQVKRKETLRFSKTPLSEMKRIVEWLYSAHGCQAITIYPDFKHAVIRKFDYKLTVDHCEPVKGYRCSTFIYSP